jgi:hypothetical protein
MAAAAVAGAVLAGIKLSPIPTCSCAKGLAAGVKIICRSDAVASLTMRNAADALSLAFGDEAGSRSATEAYTPARKLVTGHVDSGPHNTASGLQAAPVPDTELAATGTCGAREALYIAQMAALG